MKVFYKKLLRLLIDKDMNETDQRKATGLSMSTIAKMKSGEDVMMAVLIRICEVLDCDIGDIVELRKVNSVNVLGHCYADRGGV